MTDARLYHFTTESNILRVTGDKVAAFLHGQFSNSIKDLSVGCGNYNLFLTHKGKVRADLYVIRREGFFDIIIDTGFCTVVKEHLEKLAPLSCCTVSLVNTLKVLHVFGGVPQWFPDLKENTMHEWQEHGNSWLLFRNDRLGVIGYDVIIESAAVGTLGGFFTSNNITKISAADIEFERIKNGVPKIGQDVTEDNLPQEGRLDHALHFEKGCYLGQEVVARLHFRGHVNRILTHFVCDGGAIAPAAEIQDAEGKVIGKVTSITTDPQTNKTFLLGYAPVKNDGAFFVAGRKLSLCSNK